MAFTTLHELYVHELTSLHNSEHQLARWLPAWIDASFCPDLSRAFAKHLVGQTERIDRLVAILDDYSVNPHGNHSVVAQIILEGGHGVMAHTAETSAADASLITVALRLAHWELAGYESAGAFAKVFGHVDAAEMLQESFDQVSSAIQHWSQLLESFVNVQTIHAGTASYRL